MRVGVRIGVDFGTVRIGLSRSDPGGVLATPVQSLTRTDRLTSDLTVIAELVSDQEAIEVVVGLPKSLSGTEGPSAQAAREFAVALAARVEPVPLRLMDERLTTLGAQRMLRAAGRSARSQRAVVDQVAAVNILQAALDLERSSGRPPGELVPTDPPQDQLTDPSPDSTTPPSKGPAS